MADMLRLGERGALARAYLNGCIKFATAALQDNGVLLTLLQRVALG